ncbi:MAG: hypothetical protein LUH03_06965 [Oscillospiraceae bacterium]|nr:hypothetical protein [Oscillospiraceae bacterium]
MKMRKLMAVLLAVVVAISAMAISAFATDYESYDIVLSNTMDTTYTGSAEFTMSAPVYAITGYAGATGIESIDITVPANYADWSYTSVPHTITYKASLNGAEVTLGTVSADSSTVGTYVDYTIDIGYWAYSAYTDASGNAVNAMLPNSGIVSTSGNTFTVTAVVSYATSYDPTIWANYLTSDWWYASDATASGVATTFTYNYSDGTSSDTIPGSAMTTAKGTPSSSSTSYVTIVSDVTAQNSSDDITVADLLTWDQTLAARAMVLSAYNSGEAYAEVTVTLENTITGFGVYNLNTIMTSDSVDSYSSLAYFLSLATVQNSVSTYVLNGSTDTLVFTDIPMSALYNNDYSVFASYLTVTESVVMNDYAGYNYGTTYTYNTDGTNGVRLRATSVVLTIYYPVDEDEVVDNDDPVEDTNSETEDDELTVDDTDDTTTEPETNPTTGIVLALVPMAVAAAAAVASKRR